MNNSQGVMDVRDIYHNIDTICYNNVNNYRKQLEEINEKLIDKRQQLNAAGIKEKFQLNGEIKALESKAERLHSWISRHEKIAELQANLNTPSMFYELPLNIKQGIEKLGGFIPQDSKLNIQSNIRNLTSMAVRDINKQEISRVEETAQKLKEEMERTTDLQSVSGRVSNVQTTLSAEQYVNTLKGKAFNELSKANFVQLDFEQNAPANSDLIMLDGIDADIKEYRNELDLEDRRLNRLIGGFPKYKNDATDLINANAALECIDILANDIRNENHPEFGELINYLGAMKKDLPKVISKLQKQTQEFDIGYITFQVENAKQRRQEMLRIQQIKLGYEKMFAEYITLKNSNGSHEEIVKMESELEKLGAELPKEELQDAQKIGYQVHDAEQIEKGNVPTPMVGHTPPENRVFDDDYPALAADKPNVEVPVQPEHTSAVNQKAEQFIAQSYERYCASTADKKALMSYSQYKLNVLKDALNYGRVGNIELEDEEIEMMMEEAEGRGR